MSDPTFRRVGMFLEINQIGGGPKYIKKDSICSIGTSSHRISIYLKGDDKSHENMSFINGGNQQRFLEQFLLELSSTDTETRPSKDSIVAMTDAINNITQMQQTLNNLLKDMTTQLEEFKNDIKKLEEFKNDIQSDMDISINELSVVDEKLDARVIALEDCLEELIPTVEPEMKDVFKHLEGASSDPMCDTLICIIVVLILLFGCIYINNKLL